jgi:hypothetical protein
MESAEILRDNQRDSVLAWIASLFTALCCILALVILAESVSEFMQLFIALRVELPLPTRLLIQTFSWVLPFLFIGMATLLIAKEFLIRETRMRLISTGLMFVVTVACVGLVYFILNLPLFDLAEKLNNQPK